MTFRRFKTNILPHTPDSAMMDSGPFAHSRNPIYVAFLLLYLGVCLLMDAPVALVFIVPAVLALRYYVIAREEAYLIRRFGATYTEYQSRVRRWL